MAARLDFPISPQPDGSTCGPTCLQSLYRFWGEEIDVGELAAQVPQLDDGGVLGVQLGCHALRRGYRVEILSYNLQMFDPTWFREPRPDLALKLRAQAAAKKKRKLTFATEAYLEFLDLGGTLEMHDLTPGFLSRRIQAGTPLLTGLSSTWLYRESREIGRDPHDDDVRGVPQGHFVVLCGFDDRARTVRVADPLRPNPFSPKPVYSVDVDRLIASILLGIVTYDANLLSIEPARGGGKGACRS